MTDAKKKLSDAVKLGQPVQGTSSGSTYICCVIHKMFNMAIRDNGGHLSMRVEPRGTAVLTEKIIAQLKPLGFGGTDNSYLSQHFNAEGSPLAACGAYGAVMEQLKHLFGADNVANLNWKECINAGN